MYWVIGILFLIFNLFMNKIFRYLFKVFNIFLKDLFIYNRLKNYFMIILFYIWVLNDLLYNFLNLL